MIPLGLRMEEGLAVESIALIADPSLHEPDDAEGLIHRFSP